MWFFCPVFWTEKVQFLVTNVTGDAKMNTCLEICIAANWPELPIFVIEIVTRGFYMITIAPFAEWVGRFPLFHQLRSRQWEVFGGSLKLRALMAVLLSASEMLSYILLLSRDPFVLLNQSAVKLEMEWTWVRSHDSISRSIFLHFHFLLFDEEELSTIIRTLVSLVEQRSTNML